MKNEKNVKIIPVKDVAGEGRGGGIWFRLGFRRTNTTVRPQLIYVHELMGDLQQGGGAIVEKRKTSQNNNFSEVVLSNEVKCHCNDFLYMNRQFSLFAIFFPSV